MRVFPHVGHVDAFSCAANPITLTARPNPANTLPILI